MYSSKHGGVVRSFSVFTLTTLLCIYKRFSVFVGSFVLVTLGFHPIGHLPHFRVESRFHRVKPVLGCVGDGLSFKPFPIAFFGGFFESCT